MITLLIIFATFALFVYLDYPDAGNPSEMADHEGRRFPHKRE